MKTMTRGELAARCDVNPETLRYYEQRGLIPEPSRSPSNYRLYSEETVQRIRFIKVAQEIGFTLKEIKELLSLRARPDAKCGDVLSRAETKIRLIDEKIDALHSMRAALSNLMSECHGELPVSECPILEALDHQARRETDE